MRLRGGSAVVAALLAARTTAVTTVAPAWMSRLPMMEMQGRKRGWSETKLEERRRVSERLARMDLAPRVRKAMQLRTT
jgi:hypothetical protein